MPTKFGFDKRLPHLSSLIASKQISRDEAIKKLEEPLYDMAELEIDITYFCKKLRISRDEFNVLMAAPTHQYSDFANWDGRYLRLKALQRIAGRIFGRQIRVYS